MFDLQKQSRYETSCAKINRPRRDSNSQSSDPKSDALSIRPQGRGCSVRAGVGRRGRASPMSSQLTVALILRNIVSVMHHILVIWDRPLSLRGSGKKNVFMPVRTSELIVGQWFEVSPSDVTFSVCLCPTEWPYLEKRYFR